MKTELKNMLNSRTLQPNDQQPSSCRKESTMVIIVHGPNLPDQSKGTFHAHKAGCKDNKKYSPWGADAMAIVSKLEVASIIYPPGEFDWDGSVEQSGPYVDDIWFAPCTAGLPDTA